MPAKKKMTLIFSLSSQHFCFAKGQELMLTSISTARIAAWPGSNSLWSRRKTACGVEGALGNQQCGYRSAGLVQCHVDGVHVQWLTT